MQAMAYGRLEIQLRSFLTSARDGGKRPAPRSRLFTTVGKGRHYVFDIKIGGARNQAGRFGKQRKSVLAGIEPQFICRSLKLTLGQQKSQRSTSTARP